jgi:UDP-N-acetylmuramoyl-tripeptide--D-alanyl-D-alanine ligase
MKPKRIQILEIILRLMAKAVLWKFEPRVIGITGSVGKTSSKEAIFAVLSLKFDVRKNEKNYNNEIGIPLTIIGAETGGRSLIKWMGIFCKWLKLILLTNSYPEVLILEMGVDRPGDMRYLLSFIRPDLGVVTNISSSHIEFFKSLENIAKEKGGLVENLKQQGFAILNADDDLVVKMAKRTNGQVLTFGFEESAIVNASHPTYYYDGIIPEGISFKLSYDGKTIPVRLNGILAKHQINAALTGVAAGVAMKMNLVEIAEALKNFKSAQGRLNLIAGIKGSYLIDDSYNASPTSTIAAIKVLADLQGTRKIAILGDMLELGDETESGHRAVAKQLAQSNIDKVLLLGKRMVFVSDELIKSGFSADNVIHFNTHEQLNAKAKEIVSEGDIVLIKGSQGMRMEKIGYELLRNQDEAGELLCRQSTVWKKTPFSNP